MVLILIQINHGGCYEPSYQNSDQYRWFTKKLGAACEVSQQAVYKWLHNKAKVSPEHVGSIVTATGGVVKAYQIRPDLPKLFPHTEKNAA